MEQEIKQRPILFGPAMVNAILAGDKTQTRRIWEMPKWAEFDTIDNGEKKGIIVPKDPKNRAWYDLSEITCPYGKIGDQLWVREKCRAEELRNGTDGVRYIAGNAFIEIENTVAASIKWLELKTYGKNKFNDHKLVGPNVPSIHMPRWASRILLEITDIRVERLHDISEDDAKAEGVQGEKEAAAAGLAWYDKPRRAFRFLWQSINGSDSWDANPWVWVIKFKVIKP